MTSKTHDIKNIASNSLANIDVEADTQNSQMKFAENEFRQLGVSSIAYIKPVSHSQLRAWMEDDTQIDAQKSYFTVHAADGTPVFVSDDPQLANLEAKERELKVVALH